MQIIAIIILGLIAFFSTAYIIGKNSQLESDVYFLENEIDVQKERAYRAENRATSHFKKIAKIEDIVLNNDYVSADLLAKEIKEILQITTPNNISK